MSNLQTSAAATVPAVKRKVPGSTPEVKLEGSPKRQKGATELPMIPTPPTHNASYDAPIEVIVPGGDMIVIVYCDEPKGLPEIHFQVTSQLLWSTSPHFRASFGPGSKFLRTPIRDDGKQVLTLQQVPEAMGIVLKLLCLQFKMVPKVVDLDTLTEVARIADEYELEAALGPLVVGLVNDCRRQSTDEDFSRPGWLLVSWVFKQDAIFQVVTNKMTITCHADYLKNGVASACPNVPEAVIDKLVELRELRIARIREHIVELQNARHGGPKVKEEHQKRLCQSKSQALECDLLQAGFLANIIRQQGYNESPAWEPSVADIVDELLCIKKVDFPKEPVFFGAQQPHSNENQHTQRKKHQKSHENCGWLRGLQDIAGEALYKDLHLQLAEFPSRKG